MIDFLINHLKENNISFHMPGHKGLGIYQKYGFSDYLKAMVNYDITEIQGADNLHQPEGIIMEIQERYKRLYQVKKSYILVNGTSCGIIASILASVKRNGKLILSRGCHRSVFSGISLGNITPCYIHPDVTEEGIMGALDYRKVAEALDENPDAEAVILPSPNYYGICSDIEKIAEEVHKRGKILIVDQAHGAHLHLFDKYCKDCDLPKAAEDMGADIVINSTHKTLATFTQTAILNVVTDRVDTFRLESYLHMVQSTSPSYLLMASHDINSKIIEKNGQKIFETWLSDLRWFYKEANKRFEGLIVTWNGLDYTKINIDAGKLGWTGSQMEEYLLKNKIVPEMVTDDIVVAMSGIGSVRSDYERLIEVLDSCVSKSSDENGEGFKPEEDYLTFRGSNKGTEKNCAENLEKAHNQYPQTKVISFGEKVIEKKLADAKGYASGDLIIPYPPGIPVVCPGEEITQEIIDYIEKLTGENRQVLGLSKEGTIHVYEPSCQLE